MNEVEKQDYYYRNGVHVKDVIDQIYQFFGSDLSSWESTCIYNIIKYLMRAKYKEDPLKDLDKIIVYVNWLKDEFYKDDPLKYMNKICVTVKVLDEESEDKNESRE